jgi:hypothetical protein
MPQEESCNLLVGEGYHNLYPKNLEMIPQSVPLTRARCNWGICFAQATLHQEWYKVLRGWFETPCIVYNQNTWHIMK